MGRAEHSSAQTARLSGEASVAAAPRVAALLAAELGHGQEWAREQVRRYEALATGYTLEGMLEQAGAAAK